jgi:WD40 repeat protein
VAAHDGWVEAVAFSPDGRHLATVGADRQLKLWESETLKLVKAAAAHTNYPRDVAFTADGKQLVTSGEDGLAILWDASGLKVLHRIDTGLRSDQQGQTPAVGGITRLTISPDGRWLALAADRQTLVYELATGLGIGVVAQFGGDAVFANKQNLLAVGDNNVRLISYEPTKFIPRSVEPKVDPKGKKLPANWPSLAGKEVGQIKRGDFSLGVAFSPDDKQLAAGKTDGTVELWNLT